MMGTACCLYFANGEYQGCAQDLSASGCDQYATENGMIGLSHPIDEVRCEYAECPDDLSQKTCCVPYYPGGPEYCTRTWWNNCVNILEGSFQEQRWCIDPLRPLCPGQADVGACCHLSGLCTDNVSEEVCVAQNAVWQGADTSCLTVDCPEYQARCRQGQSEPRSAVDEFGQPLREWTTDLCAVAFFAPVLRPPEHQPAPFEEGDEPGFLPGEGDFELLSVNPVRAMMVDMPNNQSDPCVRHYAKMARLANGDFGAAYCSQPGANAREDRQIHLGDLYCQPDGEDPDAVLPPGDCAFVGLYHTPFWTEALYHSEAPVCGGMSQ